MCHVLKSLWRIVMGVKPSDYEVSITRWERKWSWGILNRYEMYLVEHVAVMLLLQATSGAFMSTAEMWNQEISAACLQNIIHGCAKVNNLASAFTMETKASTETQTHTECNGTQDKVRCCVRGHKQCCPATWLSGENTEMRGWKHLKTHITHTHWL